MAAIQLQNSDLNDYYGGAAAFRRPSVTESYDLAFGWQFSQPFAIEFGTAIGPFRSSSAPVPDGQRQLPAGHRHDHGQAG